VGQGAQRRIAEQIRSMGSNLVIVMSGAMTSGGARLGAGTQLTLTEDDARAITLEVPGVEAVAPTVRGAAQAVAAGANWSTVILGVTPEFLVAREWNLAAGRMFSAGEADAAAKVAVLGETVRANLFGAADPVGQAIRIRKVPFTVVGVLERKGQTTMGQDQDDLILVPLATAKRKVLGITLANPRAVAAIAVRAREGTPLGEVQAQVRDLLRQRHRLQPGEDDDFVAMVLTDVFGAQEEAARIMTGLLAAIASVSLVVGGIGVMNIMLVSVTERTREIGLRMAVGARSRDILAQFLVEALTLSLAGGLLGIVAGVAGSLAVARLAGWGTEVSAGAVSLAFVFAAAVGVFFGFYPAHKASRLDPIEALRWE
jgi:putative ABC transport system permease protein